MIEQIGIIKSKMEILRVAQEISLAVGESGVTRTKLSSVSQGVYNYALSLL